MNIHKQLKTIRELLGITQKELGAKANATQKQVSYIENGQDCYVSTLRALLNVMGYDLAAVQINTIDGGKNGFRDKDL